jgi:hypothetical protein
MPENPQEPRLYILLNPNSSLSQLSITSIYGISSVLSVLLRVTAFYYLYIWYLQCIFCHSSCHSFLLPLYMVSPVYCLSDTKDRQYTGDTIYRGHRKLWHEGQTIHWWYHMSVILRVTAFYYPYIWYLQYIVCHSSCYSFLLPLYMVSPVYCLSFFVLQLSIPLYMVSPVYYLSFFVSQLSII